MLMAGPKTRYVCEGLRSEPQPISERIQVEPPPLVFQATSYHAPSLSLSQQHIILINNSYSLCLGFDLQFIKHFHQRCAGSSERESHLSTLTTAS